MPTLFDLARDVFQKMIGQPVGDYFKDAFQAQGDRMSNTSAQLTGTDFDSNGNGVGDYITEPAIKDFVSSAGSMIGTQSDPFSPLENLPTESSAQSNSNAQDLLAQLFNNTGDKAWLEKYIDNMFNQEMVNSARQYETEMSNTAYSRAFNDIKGAGYNPWMLLNQSAASTPSVAAATSSGISSSSQATSRYNQKVQSNADIAGRVVTGIGIAAAMIIKALV